jgi:hypothetical protein
MNVWLSNIACPTEPKQPNVHCFLQDCQQVHLDANWHWQGSLRRQEEAIDTHHQWKQQQAACSHDMAYM